MAQQGAVAALVASLGAYSKEVEDLHGPYELELLEAASACWVEKQKIVQARGKFGLRTRQVVVTEPSFIDEAERQLLGGALADWQRKAESDVGAAALDTRIAERRLLHAAARLIERAKMEPAALPAFLDECLGAVAGAGAPAQLVSPSAFMLLRDISLTVTQSYLEAIGGEPDGDLVRVLRRYAGKLPWATSMFQPAVSQAPALLRVLLEAYAQDGEALGKAALLKGSVALVLQFKWSEHAGDLPASQMKTAVLPLLLSLAHQIGGAAQQDNLPVNEAVSLIHSIIQVLQAIAAGMPEMTNTMMAATLQILLCLSLDITASNLAGILCMNKDVSLPLEEVELLSLAQLVWSRTGDSQCSVLAVKVAQQCDWQAALAAMTKPMQLRSALVMLALYKAGGDDVDPAASQRQRWIWDLLQGPVGSTLSSFAEEGVTKAASAAHAHGQQQAVQEEGMEAAHMLCMAAAPAAREEVLALWAWLRTQWALGLLKAWAMASNAEAVGRANALLEGMQFFEQCDALLAAGQHKAAISVVLRFSIVANLLARRFVRGKLMSMAGVLSQCVGSRSADDANRLMQPIVRAVTKDVQLGAKPATSSLTAKDADQVKSPRKEPVAIPSLTGTHVAWQWATLLCCTAVQTRLPSAALQLLNDLVQLLFYYTEHSMGNPASNYAEGTATQMQEAIGAAVEILGPDAAQRLWVPLLAAQAEQPVKLQWLPLLACWLASPPQASTRPGAAAPESVHASSTSAQQQLKGQAAPAGDQQQTRGSNGNRDRGGSPPSPAMGQPSSKLSPDGLPGASPAMSAKGSPGSRDGDKSSSMIVQDFNLDQHAEQAFQLQEAAMRAGYAAAALPLWEQFLWRFFSFQAQLEDIVPCSAISRHLAELAHLYEATSPTIANIYVLIASLSPESLPQGSTGKGLDFISSNVEAQRALMQLHPCKLMILVQSTAPAPAATGNGQTGLNGWLGRADLSQADSAAVPAQQLHGAVTDHASLRKPAPEASAYQDICRAQEELLADCANAAAHIATWANRRGKRAADNPVPQEPIQSDPASNGEAAGSGAADHGKAVLAMRLKSPRHSSGREGDVPESISQAQARLWEGLSTLSEHLDVLHGTLRELVVRRFREPDMAAIEAGRFGEAECLPADEVPDYQEQWQRNREAAFSAAMEFSKGADIAEAARNLYLVEVVMADGQIRSEDSAAPHERGTDSHRCQLLTVLGETVLDESMPAAGVPFCMAKFQQAAPSVLGPSPAAKAEVTPRLMSALALRGEGASRPKEALTLLNHALGSDRLLVQGRLQEYCACLSAVLSGCASLQAELASSLLMCFDMRGLCVAMMQARPAATHQVDMQAHLQRSTDKAAPSKAAMQLLDVSLKTAAVPGGTAAAVQLLEGIAAAGGVAAYLNACLAVTLSYGSANARQQGLAWLTGLQLDDAPLSALTEAISQVTAALNEAESAQHEIPYAFIQHLIQAPSALEALHQSLKIDSGASDGERALHADGIWTAAVGDSAPSSAASAASSRAPDMQPGPSVLLLPVQSGRDAAASIELLIGACLQSILRRFGSGLDGHSIAEELTQLLALLMEPVGSQLWLVDWLWHLYKESLQPFLMLAGPASDGLAVMRFREMWGCLPWHQATFHSSSPEGLADLGAYLLAPDHGAMDLLRALPWDSILAALAPAVRPGASLDGQSQQWATQLALLALQCMVLLPQSQLPVWLLDLAQPLCEQSGGSVKLRLPHVIAAADSAALEDILCAEVEGIPYLLQPLVDIPMHVKGDPSVQLQSITSMLSSAAHLSSKPEVAALASRVQQGLLFKSVGRAFIDGRAHAEADSSCTSSAAEVRECWHLSAESHSLLVMDGLLPLAALHAAAVAAAPSLSRQTQHRAAPNQEAAALLSARSQSARWSAPQLSALVNRLQDSHHPSAASAAEHSQPGRPERGRPPSRLASGSMAQPEHERAGELAPGKTPQAPGCISAAAPAHALLSCLTAEARTFLTSDPVPFANAETPLQDAAPRLPLAADGRSGEAAAAEAASRLHDEHQRGAGSAMKQGAGALLDRARSVTRQLQMKGRNSSELKRQRFMRAEAVASVRDIQVHIAGLIDDACQHGSCELAMSLLRVGCTMPALRRLPLGSALLESLVASLMSEQHAPAAEDALRHTASGEHHPGRRSSYTEQALAAAVETPAPSVTGKEHRPASTAGQLLQCLGGLGSEAVLQVCADASALQSPLLQAVASEKARRLVAEEEQASWRHSVSEVLRAAALAEAQPEHPRHAAAVWLAALLWLEDARWRKLRSGGAPTDALEALLDALSRRVLLLSLPAPEDTAPIRPVATAPGSSGQTGPPSMDVGTPGHEGKSSSLSRFTQKVSGMVPSFRSDSTGVSSADGQQDRIDDGQAVQPRSKTLAKFRGRLFGNKNKLPPGTVDIPPSAFDYGSSMSMQQAPGSRLETIPSDDFDDSFQQGYSSSQDSPKAAGQEAGPKGLSVRTASRAFSEEGRPPSKQEHTSSARDTASKLALDVKRALRIGRRAEIAAAEAAAEAAEEEEAAEAAADVVIRLGLAAFAISAYIKTVLCPSMSSYTPRMSSASLAADLAGSGGALTSVLLHRQSASLSSLPGHSQGGTPRMMGTSQLGTPTTSLDKLQRDDMLMHELDQVLETRAELDSLEELANCPMVARRADRYSAFFAAAPEMLQSTRSVADFERRLVELLFPEAPYLHCLAIAH